MVQNKFYLLAEFYRSILEENFNFVDENKIKVKEALQIPMEEWTLEDVDITTIFNLFRLSAIFKAIDTYNVTLGEYADELIAEFYEQPFGQQFVSYESLSFAKLSLSGWLNAIYCREFEQKYHIQPSVSLIAFDNLFNELADLSKYGCCDILEHIENQMAGEYTEGDFDEDDETLRNNFTFNDLNEACFEVSALLNRTKKPFLGMIDKSYRNDLPENLAIEFLDYMGDLISDIIDFVPPEEYDVHCISVLNNSYERINTEVHELLAELN